MPDFTIERLVHQPTLAIRGRIPLAAAPSFFDRSYSALFALAEANGGRIAGAPLSCTRERTDDAIDVEVALPLVERVPGAGEIVESEVPPVEAATTHHVGSYTRLGETYGALLDYVRSIGREATGVGYEFYVDDPGEVPVDARRTKVALPLREQHDGSLPLGLEARRPKV